MRYTIIVSILFFLSCNFGQKQNETSTAQEFTNKTPITQEPLEVYDFEGLERFLNKKDDKVHVINFWATWCAPCIKELPYFEKLNQSYKSEVEVILVSLDFPSKYDSNLKPYIKEHDLKSKVVALNDTDSDSWIPKVSEDWTGAIPATIIYNKDKRSFYERSFNYEQLEQEVKQFLN